MKAGRTQAVLLLALGLLTLSGPALAQDPAFFASVELPQQFTINGAGADSVNGFSAYFAFPVYLGLGLSSINVATRDKSLDRDLEISMQTFDVFLHIPSELWIWVIGTGNGTASYSPDSFTETVGPVRLEPTPVEHYFARIGFRITAQWAAELGYHVFSGSSDVTVSGSKRGKTELNASMYGLGASFAF